MSDKICQEYCRIDHFFLVTDVITGIKTLSVIAHAVRFIPCLVIVLVVLSYPITISERGAKIKIETHI